MRRLALAVTVMLLAACGGDEAPKDAVNADTVTRRQRDSVIGASKLPGARGVQRALSAQDSVAARNARADSIANDTTP